MAAKMTLAFCTSALLVQTAFSQCAAGRAGWNGLAGPGLAGLGLGLASPSLGLVSPGGYGAGCGCGAVASTGGGLAVFSASPIAPIGISVVSENTYEGVLTAGGNVPFLSTIGIEGVVPAYGTGAILYGCGNGAVGITAEEGPIATGIAPSVSTTGFATPGLAGLGCNGLGYNGVRYLGYGPTGCRCGYGAIL